MSSRTFAIAREELQEELSSVEPIEEVGEDSAMLNEIVDGLSQDHNELSQLLDQASVFSDVSEQFPEGTILTISEEKILNAMVKLVGAGTANRITAESLKVFKRDTAGTQLSLEALEGGVWATIKRILAAIAEKILKFWAWLTGSGEKKIEATQKKTEENLKAIPEEKWKDIEKKIEEADKSGTTMGAAMGDALRHQLASKKAEGVSKEEFEYHRAATPNVHHITGARLSRFTDKKPSGSLVILEDVVEDVGKQMELGKKIIDGCGLMTGSKWLDHIDHEPSDQEVITASSEQMGKLSSLLGLHDGGEIKVIGTTYLHYDAKNLRYSIETKDDGIEHDKNYIIGMRSPREVLTSYTKYVNAYRADAAANTKGDLKKLGDCLTEFVSKLDENKEESLNDSWKGRSSEVRQAIMINVHAFGVLVTAFSKLTHVALELESSLFGWVPKAG